MLWSGEWARHHEPGAISSEAENRLRGRQALERGGESPEGVSVPRARQSLHSVAPGPRRRGSSPKGYHDRSVGGPLWLLWTVVLYTLGWDHTERVFGVHGVFVCVLLFFEKGVSSGH
jgi:hypothetical protein